MEKFFQVSSQLPPQEREELIGFHRRNVDVFAWSAYEAPGVDPNFICHHLNFNPFVTPKKQPPWRLSKDHSEAIKEEVMKLKQVGAIKWEVVSVCRFHRPEQSLSKWSFPPALDRPISRCNHGPSSDKLPRCLPRILLDTASLRRSRKDNFCHSHWKLPLQSDALWVEKCRVYLSKDDDENVWTTVGQEHWSLHRWHSGEE